MLSEDLLARFLQDEEQDGLKLLRNHLQAYFKEVKPAAAGADAEYDRMLAQLLAQNQQDPMKALQSLLKAHISQAGK